MTDVSEITTHVFGFGGRGRSPAINVKVYNFTPEADADGDTGYKRLAKEFHISEQRATSLIERAWEWQQSDFWERASETAQEHLQSTFGVMGHRIYAYSDGRSGGWLRCGYRPIDGQDKSRVGLRDFDELDEWTDEQAHAWAEFEAAIRDDVAYFSSYEAVVETLEANDLLDTEAERLEAKARAEAAVKGFGYVVLDSIERLSQDAGASLYIVNGEPDRAALAADGRIRPTFDRNDWSAGDYTFAEDTQALYLTGTGAMLWRVRPEAQA